MFVWSGEGQKFPLCVHDHSLTTVENQIQGILLDAYGHFSLSTTPLHLTAVLPFEDIAKGVQMSPTTEATALENNKHCRTTQWLLASLRAQPWEEPGNPQPKEAQQPWSSLPEAVLLQILKLHGFDTLGKIWTIFCLTAASPSSLGYIYWILQATIHPLNLNQC